MKHEPSIRASTWHLTLALTCAVAVALPLFADDKPIRHTEFDHAVNHVALRYLPEERYSGDDQSPRGDYEMLLSLHLPTEGDGPFPVVFYVHGGAWAEGNKEGQAEMAEALNERGIAFVGFNYILRPKGIFPQVWWDLHNAARFLRREAVKYNLDPLRFGAYGLSAGGWVISSACIPSGDHLATSSNNGAITAAELVERGGSVKVKDPADEFAWLKPMRDPSPAWPGEAGGFSALSFDFAYHVEHGDAASPAIQQWVGRGAKPKYADKIVDSELRVTVTELTAPKYAGKHVHIPPFFKRDTKEASDAIDLDGKPGKLLGEVVVDFFERELKSPAARPPAPEVYPVPRIINGPSEVTLLAPRGATIHYTTDGSEPTTDHPVYQQPFTIEPGVTVEAITAAPGMTPSGPTVARFVSGEAPPTITGPDSLPAGKVGKAYAVHFSADTPAARWNMQGDLRPYVPWKKKEMVYPNGMQLDVETGTWAGTPDRAGSYWVQVWVARGAGQVAGYRNYRWVVTD